MITASIGGRQAHVIDVPEGDPVERKGYRGIVIIDDAALESLHDRDLATYCELIRLSDELWQREWGEQW